MTQPTDHAARLAQTAHRAAADLIDQRRFVEALPHALEVTRLAPASPTAWLDLVITCKHALRWPELLAAADRALALGVDGDSLTGVCWNAGIAATALGDWARARSSWAGAGVRLPVGAGPIELDFGRTPIRVAAATASEVVWCDRIDPCRAWIASVPLPDSGRRYRDLVLHDGEPRGKRALGERMVSVFDELTVLERSRHRTWEAIVHAPRPSVVGALLELFEETSVVVEDWTSSLEMMCKECSQGTPHAHRDPAPPPWQPERRLAFAALDEGDLAPLRQRRAVVSLREVA